jgi:hypothetical protein
MALELDRAALDHFARLIGPIRAMGDADGLNALLDTLGWNAAALGIDPTELAQGVAGVEEAIEALQALVEKEKITLGDLGNALTTVALDIKEIIEAVNSLGAAGGVSGEALQKLGEDLAGFLLVHYVATTWPKVRVVLKLLGLLPTVTISAIARADGQELRRATQHEVFDLTKLGAAISDPLGYLRTQFLLDPQGGKRAATAIADLIGGLLAEVLIDAGAAASYGKAAPDGRPALVAAELDALLHLLVTDFVLATDSEIAHLRLVAGLTDLPAYPNEVAVLLGASGDFTIDIPTPVGSVTLTLSAAGQPVIISAHGIDLAAGGAASFNAGIAYRTDPATTPAIRFGAPDGLRFEIGSIAASLALAAGASPDVSGSVDLKEVLLAIQGGDGDGFLASVLPRDPILIKADFGMDVGLRSGVRFRGSAELEKRFVLNLVLGPLKIPAITIGVGLSSEGLRARLTGTIGLAMGPLQAVVEDMGLAARLRPALPRTPGGTPAGNVGPFDLSVAFKPPSGAGLSIAAGPVTGGGYIFFDPENEQYAGVLQLSFKTIGLTVIGLLTTRLPDPAGAPGATKKGFSLLLIITFDLPPIQLGYGFTLNGVGGLLGINRTMVVDALRNGVRTGTVDSILFPSNPVGRAAEIISNLRAIFPPAEGRYVFGPMVKIGWGPNAIIELQAAVVVELMAPIRLVILGKVQIALPDKKDGVVVLRLDIVGVIDFDRSEVSVDASLVDSRIAAFAITGDMALRVGWGATKQFALAAGGFHPRFDPPAGFPELRRLAISLANSDNPRLRLESYFALTANTIQFGAGLEIYASMDTIAGTFSIQALANFDALIQFQPFKLEADLGASIDIARNGTPFLHAALHASLTGPNPWRAMGYAEFDFLGKHRVAFDATIGEPAPAPPVVVEQQELATKLAEAFSRPDAWAALPPASDERIVTLRKQPSGDRTLVHPLGALEARQRLLPLDKSIERFGAAIVTPIIFQLRGFNIGGTIEPPRTTLRDDFAPGQFTPLTDDERVARPAFEAMQSGGSVKVAAFKAPADMPTGVTVTADYEEAFVDVEPQLAMRVATIIANPLDPAYRSKLSATLTPATLGHLTRGGAAAFAPTRAGGASDFAARSLAVGVSGERYVAAGVNDLAPLASSPAGGASCAEAHDDIAASPARKSLQAAMVHEVVP